MVVEFFSSGIRRLTKGTYKIRIEKASIGKKKNLIKTIDVEARILDGPNYKGRQIIFSFEEEGTRGSAACRACKLLSRDEFEYMCAVISDFEIKDTSELIGAVLNIEVSKKAPFYIYYEGER